MRLPLPALCMTLISKNRMRLDRRFQFCIIHRLDTVGLGMDCLRKIIVLELTSGWHKTRISLLFTWVRVHPGDRSEDLNPVSTNALLSFGMNPDIDVPNRSLWR